MYKVIGIFISIIILASILLYIDKIRNDSVANRLYAESRLVAAKSEARLDYLAGVMPYMILSISFLSVLIIAIVFVYVYDKKNSTTNNYYLVVRNVPPELIKIQNDDMLLLPWRE